MSNKNILAYFKSPEDANKAADEIKNLASYIKVDRLSKYPLGSADKISNPTTGDIPSQATLTLGANSGHRDTGILASTDVSASGMSDGGQSPITGRDVLLAAIVDESVFEQARQLIHKGDGLV